MTDINKEQKALVQQIYNYAAKLMVEDGKTSGETKRQLTAEGLPEPLVNEIVNRLESEVGQKLKEAGEKNMLYGALWAIGGLVATLSGIGFIFYGAIIFGAIQFFNGVNQVSKAGNTEKKYGSYRGGGGY